MRWYASETKVTQKLHECSYSVGNIHSHKQWDHGLHPWEFHPCTPYFCDLLIAYLRHLETAILTSQFSGFSRYSSYEFIFYLFTLSRKVNIHWEGFLSFQLTCDLETFNSTFSCLPLCSSSHPQHHFLHMTVCCSLLLNYLTNKLGF